MKNYIQPGNTVTLPTGTGGCKSGDVLKVNAFIGVAAADAGAAQDVEVHLVGCFELSKAAEQIEIGEAIYWNGSACTASDSGNTLLGVAIAAAGTNDAKVRVRLNGVAVW